MTEERLAPPSGSRPGWLADRWERHVVPRLIRVGCSQPAVMKDRSRLVPDSDGDVLELGCGGGINLAFYDPARVRSLTGLDPSPELLDYTREEARARGVGIDIHRGVGEQMPFADAHFDTVLTTFTLCSVADGKQVLAEARRVLRPGGKLLFLEHGRAPDAGPEKWQRRIEPVWKRIAGGCHLNRPVADRIAGAGFRLVRREGHYAPKTPRWLGWMEMGEARPL